jgi:hypothetical protein
MDQLRSSGQIADGTCGVLSPGIFRVHQSPKTDAGAWNWTDRAARLERLRSPRHSGERCGLVEQLRNVGAV